jgi:uncharacterized protein YcsI (UPF0317 family)
VGDPGDPALPFLGREIDVRTDVPRYRVWREGRLVDEPTDVRMLWSDDMVSFVLGCSFSFEQTLIDEGIVLRNVEQKRNVAMYRTNVPTVAAGLFSGPLVVTMTPWMFCRARCPSSGPAASRRRRPSSRPSRRWRLGMRRDAC